MAVADSHGHKTVFGLVADLFLLRAVILFLLARHLCPAVSMRYSTASPLKGGRNDCEEAPAGMGFWAIVSPVAGLNHSTASVRDFGIAERSMVKAPPEGA